MLNKNQTILAATLGALAVTGLTYVLVRTKNPAVEAAKLKAKDDAAKIKAEFKAKADTLALKMKELHDAEERALAHHSVVADAAIKAAGEKEVAPTAIKAAV